MICSLSTLNRNKIPLIPTPHFHPQFSYSLHHDHYCHISMVSSLLPPRHPPMHFYCFQHHQHHISILLSPPPPSPKQPHFSSFPSTTTITTLLLFSHHHNISIVFFSIVSRATLWRHIIAELSRAQRSTTGKKYGNLLYKLQCFTRISTNEKCGIWTHVKIRYFTCEDIDNFTDIRFVS